MKVDEIAHKCQIAYSNSESLQSDKINQNKITKVKPLSEIKQQLKEIMAKVNYLIYKFVYLE